MKKSSDLQVSFSWLTNKDLSIVDCLVLGYIKHQMNEESLIYDTNYQMVQVLGVGESVVANSLSKLYKLGYVEIHFNGPERIITYTYDAPHSLSNSGYIYIMKDEGTKYIKIGFSKNPTYRESTLQAEKPTITLVNKWKGTMSQEQTVHRILAKHRIRGEWFNCNIEQAGETIKKVIGVI